MESSFSGRLVGWDIHGFRTLEDLDIPSIMKEAGSRWLRPNEIHAILSNYSYFTINVKPVNLPKALSAQNMILLMRLFFGFPVNSVGDCVCQCLSNIPIIQQLLERRSHPTSEDFVWMDPLNKIYVVVCLYDPKMLTSPCDCGKLWDNNETNNAIMGCP